MFPLKLFWLLFRLMLACNYLVFLLLLATGQHLTARMYDWTFRSLFPRRLIVAMAEYVFDRTTLTTTSDEVKDVATSKIQYNRSPKFHRAKPCLEAIGEEAEAEENEDIDRNTKNPNINNNNNNNEIISKQYREKQTFGKTDGEPNHNLLHHHHQHRHNHRDQFAVQALLRHAIQMICLLCRSKVSFACENHMVLMIEHHHHQHHDNHDAINNNNNNRNRELSSYSPIRANAEQWIPQRRTVRSQTRLQFGRSIRSTSEADHANHVRVRFALQM